MVTTPNKDPLHSERGSSLVEFLICAPLLTLLAYGAYDLNKRVEQQQTVSILSRNAAYLGGGVGEDRQRANAGDVLLRRDGATGTVRILDRLERNALSTASTTPGSHGIFVQNDDPTSEKPLTPSNDDKMKRLKDRMGGAKGVATVSKTTVGSSFDRMSSAFGKAADTSATVLTPILTAGKELGVFIDDGIRETSLETSAPGSTNAIQRALGVVSAAAQTETLSDPEASYQEETARRRLFGQRFYVRAESGFHPNKYTSFAFVGMGLGHFANTPWGNGGKADFKSAQIQSRCMTRIMSSDNCTGNPTKTVFRNKVAALASAKLALSTALTAAAGPTMGASKIAEVAINEAVKQVAGSLLKGAADSVRDAALSELKKRFATGEVTFDKQIASMRDRVFSDISPGLDANDLKGVLKEDDNGP